MTDSHPSPKRVASWLPFAAAIAVPLVLLAVMGLFSFRQGTHEAELRAQRTVQALTEHALRTFRAHDLIIAAVDKYIAGWDWAQIDASPQLHDFFKALSKDADDINTIFVIGPTGRDGNSSLVFPLAPTDMRGRPFYEELRLKGGLHVSGTDVGRVNKQRYFSFTRRRTAPDGAFDGVISVSVNPVYFENFYKTMVENPEDSFALVRSDGLMLVRVPVLTGASAVMLPKGPGGLMAAIETDPVTGTFSRYGSIDGVERIYAYRRVGEYPLYVSYGLSYAAVWAAWWRNMLAYSVVCLLATGLLLAAAALVRGHNRREADASRRYAEETARRMSAEETNRTKDEFLAMLSHELRNPLASISASVELLRRVRNPDANAQRAVDIIGRQIDHLRRLLNDLLDVARSVYGKLNLDPRVVSLLDLASSVAAAHPGAIRHEVDVKVGGVPGWIHGDPTRIRQMIENLIDNAQKYGARSIGVEVAESGTSVALTVTDDGKGIPADLMPTLFQPFVQGKQPLDRASGGLGLGLALVERLAVAHGGTLRAHSEGPGKGSTFTVSLPMSQPPEAPPSHARPAPGMAGARILVIEDQQDVRDSLRMLLELDQHEVETASNGPDGVAKFDAFSPNVVLVDIGLPGMNGYEVAHAIRARDHGKRAALIALTGYGQPDDQRLAHDAGFSSHMTKPVSYQDLKDVLARV